MSLKSNSLYTLVVGSDSFIGRALIKHLRQTDKYVIGTTKRRESVDGTNLYLDLSERIGNWYQALPCSVAVICAGETKLDDCKRNPKDTARINVQGVYGLVERLVAEGVFVIYLSTSQVFDGTVPYRMAEDPVSPVTEYGRQKAEVERRVLALGDSVSIVRFTKVVGPDMPLFSKWIYALLNDESIHPFSDMVISPVPILFSAYVLSCLIKLRLPGIFQVSGSKDVTYEQVAHYFAKYLKTRSELIQPVASSEAGIQFESIPSYTTMDISRLREEVRVEPPSICSAIESIIS